MKQAFSLPIKKAKTLLISTRCVCAQRQYENQKTFIFISSSFEVINLSYINKPLGGFMKSLLLVSALVISGSAFATDAAKTAAPAAAPTAKVEAAAPAKEVAAAPVKEEGKKAKKHGKKHAEKHEEKAAAPEVK
ncbi:MAG: hypothetical protein ACOYOK_05765 [Pseudobdellovibrionaceae bacterium]